MDQELTIQPGDQQQLSEDQQLFNELTRQIAEINQKIEQEKSRLDLLNTAFAREIPALYGQIAQEKIKLARLLHQATFEFKYSRKQIEIFRTVILYLLETAFESVTPDPETNHIYQQWSGAQKKDKESEMIELKLRIAAELRFEYGILINPESYKNTPEGFVAFQAAVREMIEQAKAQKQQSADNKKKNKKQAAADQRRKEQEVTQTRNIRSIYIALAKVLHPDSSSQDIDTHAKEELMKKVTKAYQDRDLSTLLRLETAWVHPQQNRLTNLDNETLRQYIASLKKRLASLRAELMNLNRQPQYAGIASLSRLSEKATKNTLKKQKAELKEAISGLVQTQYSLQHNFNKREVQYLVNELSDILYYKFS